MDNEEQQPDIKKIFIGAGIGIVVLGAIVYIGYSFTKKSDTSKTEVPAEITQTQPSLFTADPAVPWIPFSQKEYSYSFSSPQTLPLYKFTDPPFSIGIKWNDVDPKYNILANQESIKVRDPKSSGNMEQYVNNWWKAYSGLTGVKSVVRFTNTNGLTGYRAVYINKAGESPNVDIFFANPENPDSVVHFANGILEPAIFDRIIDSVKFGKASGVQSPQSNGQAVTEATPTSTP